MAGGYGHRICGTFMKSLRCRPCDSFKVPSSAEMGLVDYLDYHWSDVRTIPKFIYGMAWLWESAHGAENEQLSTGNRRGQKAERGREHAPTVT